MRYKIILISVFCTLTAIAINAAEPKSTEPDAKKAAAETKAKAAADKAKADAEAKAAKANAEAKAVSVGEAYAAELAKFNTSLKDNKLDEASASAKEMIKLSAEPGKAPWQPTMRTYFNVIKQFEGKKLFGSKYTLALYEDAIKNTTAANEKADLTLQYGLFLYKYALVDDKKAKDIIESAFSIPDISKEKQIQLCQRVAEADPSENLDAYSERALSYAKDDPVMRIGIYSWIIRAYKDKNLDREDEIVPLYEKILADKSYSDELLLKMGREMVEYLNKTKQFDKSRAYLNKTLPTLQAREKLSFLWLLADTHKKAAVRFYSEPDKKDLQLAIDAYRESIKEIPQDKVFDIANVRLQIAETAYTMDDYPTVIAEATQILAIPELQQKQLGTKLRAEYFLGQAAYAEEDYAKAIEILEPIWKETQSKPQNSVPRRDLIETLVRSYCAVRDFEKATGLSDELLKSVKNHEQARYKIYIEGLKQRGKPNQ
ncbi:MAG: hypothetical protein A2X49_08300 [Lentisphaerae bacterium GWF2_52_8]|nr:MAG: hypothetical protein A2X49_08300 [Lentisphaerae bacterium GWF2_52_8]